MDGTPRGRCRLVFALTLTLVGCGPDEPVNHVIAATNYDRRCASVADCRPITEGTAGCCGFAIICPNAAIALKAIPRYASDVQSATTCAVQPPCPAIDGIMCTGRITCTAGLCGLGSPPPDASATE
jgi:hypothetical protein